jgi:archaemetzincin
MTLDNGRIDSSDMFRPVIGVIPFGEPARDVLAVVSDSIQAMLRIPVDVLSPIPLPDHAYMAAREQYNAMAVIKYLATLHTESYIKLLGITGQDICNPIVTYVYGEAYMNGRAAVMSYARLSPGTRGTMVPREVQLERAVKVALHEIGHTFNLAHCLTDRCVMKASHNILQLDEKLNYLCDYCEAFLADSLTKTLTALSEQPAKTESL